MTNPIFLQPTEAIKFITDKRSLPSWNWYDMTGQMHNYAFTVSKMTQVDLLSDVKAAVKRAMDQGLTGEQFRELLEKRMQVAGWWGKQTVINPEGVAQKVTLGTPWRIETIFRTNTQSAYMAGKWQQFYDNKADRPFLEYVAVLDSSTRPSHRALHGFIAPVTDSRWNSIMPPNGYNCRCRVRALTAKQAQARNKDLKVPQDFPDQGFSNNPGIMTDATSSRLLYQKATNAGRLDIFKEHISNALRHKFLAETAIPGIAQTGAIYMLNKTKKAELFINKKLDQATAAALVKATGKAGVEIYKHKKKGELFVPVPGEKSMFFVFAPNGRYKTKRRILIFGKQYEKL